MNKDRLLLMGKFKKGITFSRLGLKTYQHFPDGYTSKIGTVYFHQLKEMVKDKEVELLNKRYCLIKKHPENENHTNIHN